MFVIFSKLVIHAGDRAWIDSIRRAHDPQQAIVAPHFTFVFPFAGVSIEEVFEHAQNIATATKTLAFRLSRAAAVEDPFSALTHVFLLPTDGADEMRELHGRLYSGVLAAMLHPTLSFIPHVTVGGFERREDADRLVDSLSSFDVGGTLEAIQVAEFDGKNVTELRQFKFTGLGMILR